MTILLGSVVLITIFTYFFHSFIRKYNKYFYGLALILSIISFTQEITIINLGYLGFAFFIVVMFASTLEQGNLRKHLMGNRAELAIIGAMFAITHGLKYLVFSLDYSFFLRSPLYFFLGIAALVIMLPLAATSFMWLRKKMKGKTWKKLHKLSYLFYGLVFLHLILINNERMIFYIVLASVYVVYRLLALLTAKNKKATQPKLAVANK